MKKDIERFSKTDLVALILIVIAICGMFGLPYLITQTSYLNPSKTDYGKPSEIGDMIGGITGPFIGFISACLVYLTLREQIRANKITLLQFENQEINRMETDILSTFMDKLKKWKLIINNVDYDKYVCFNQKTVAEKTQEPFYSATFNLILDLNLLLQGEEVRNVSRMKLDNLMQEQTSHLQTILSEFRFALLNIYQESRLLLIARELEQVIRYDIGISEELIYTIASRELTKDYHPNRKLHNHFLFRLFELHKIEYDLNKILSPTRRLESSLEKGHQYYNMLESLYLNDVYFKDKIVMTLNSHLK